MSRMRQGSLLDWIAAHQPKPTLAGSVRKAAAPPPPPPPPVAVRA